MDRKNSFWFVVMVITALFALNSQAADWVSFDGSIEHEYLVKVLSSDQNLTVLQFEFPGMFVDQTRIDGELFHQLKFYSFATTQDIGLPALPIVVEMLAIPGTKKVKASAVNISSTVLEGYHVMPYQTPTTDDNPSAVFDIDRTVYSTDAWYPETSVVLGDIGIMRDLRVVPVRVNPFRYNPATGQLEVATRMEVKLEYFGYSDQTVKTQEVTEVSSKWAETYRSKVVNFDNLNVRSRPATDEFQVKYLIICPLDAVDYIQPLADFRNAQGYGVEIRPMEQGFNTSTQFREYIHQLYESDGLEYVLMVGDWYTGGHQITPMHMWSNTWSDSWYTMVDPWPNTGNDYYADLAIGRFVYDNNNQLEHQINKTMSYLTNPSTADNWAEHTLLVAHSEQYPQKYTQCKEEIRTYPYSTQIPIFGQAYGGAGATNQDVINYLNTNGSGILNYRGHGSQTEWWSWGPTGGFGAPEIAQLTNADKLFVHFDVCCDNMDFPGYNGNCFCESFMKHQYGCVAIHSAIIPSYTIPNHDYDKEFYKAIYDLDIFNIGYASNFANITVYQAHGSIGQSNIRTYLWLGDAAIDPWTNIPQELTVSHMPVMYLGMSELDVSVQIDGVPVPHAMVCAQNEETYSVGYTDANGDLTLVLDAALTQPGMLNLMVTCHNGLPYQAEIILTADGSYILFNDCDVNDATGWIPNGQLDYDETSYLTVAVENVGNVTADNVNIALTSPDPNVSILDGEENYGSITGGEITSVTDGFQVAIAGSVPDMHIMPFVITATSGLNEWISDFTLTAHAPTVEYGDLDIADPTGNNNNALEPGETVDFTVYFDNIGSSDAINLDVEISCILPGITIPFASGMIATVPANGSGSVTFEGIAAEESIPLGTEATFNMTMSGDGGYEAEDSFTILVGNALYAPTGPDAYGYSAWEINDGGVDYEWMEIAPAAGGPGTALTMTSLTTVHLDLPFDFIFYGNTFDEISVCSNGWIAMGYTSSTAYTNMQMPYGMIPDNLIAAFWEHMNPATGNGQISYYHDAANNRYIVEWYQVNHFLTGADPETFQVVFYDPAHYPTLTGDGEIQVNYHTVSNPSSVTIGIENDAGDTGLQYVYNTLYDVHASPLENEFAIKYIPGDSPTGDISVSLTPVSLPIQIPANGGSFDFNIGVSNAGMVQVTVDIWSYITLPSGDEYGPVINFTGFNLDPGANPNRDRIQAVPAGAPTGMYTYDAYVGNFPSGIWGEDHFDFEKIAVDDGGAIVNDWSNWGEDFSDINGEYVTEIPTAYSLRNAYPNPFNPETNLAFDLPESGYVTLIVFDIQGREIVRLADGFYEPGYYSRVFNAESLSSGIYFARLHAGNNQFTQKLLLVK